jgi:hypothetical protein
MATSLGLPDLHPSLHLVLEIILRLVIIATSLNRLVTTDALKIICFLVLCIIDVATPVPDI